VGGGGAGGSTNWGSGGAGGRGGNGLVIVKCCMPAPQLLDLRTATTYQGNTEYNKQAAVSDISAYVDSTTGRPWSQCGQYSSSRWWGVDLGANYHVSYIRMQNRNDCCADRLYNVEVRLGSSTTRTSNPAVASSVRVEANQMKQQNIGAQGRYLFLHNTGGTGLTICKIYVFASPPPPAPARLETCQGLQPAIDLGK
jgi:hypothetical protein